ncbi:MAG: DUF126 domain-containing protein [Candidatus Diapherotrites archaeon]
MKLKGRTIYAGKAEGEALVSKDPLSFYGGVNLEKGIVVEKGHCLEGKNIAGKILVFPNGKGSTVGSYAIYRLKKAGKAPAAIVNKECETIVAVGAIISEIPCVDKIDIAKIKDCMKVKVDAGKGEVEI